ncbi:sensor histidine kinase [Sediminispirochaeta smaragdinae]|nr:HAMP domain-containing sensor histidine kinase [Sediminispirochaeta smaragdinae]
MEAIMLRFDHYRCRILALSVLIALSFAYPFSTKASILALALTFATMGLRFLPIIPSTLALLGELLFIVFGAAASGVTPLLFFAPLVGSRIAVDAAQNSGWKLRLPFAVSVIGPCAAGLLSLSPFLPFFAATAIVTPLVLLFTLLLIRNQEAKRLEIEKRLKTKEAILSTLAHEIRTPLTVIQSTVDLLIEERIGPLEERQHQFLSSVGSNVQRLVTLSDTILASIKVESAWFTIKVKPIDIRKVIKNVALHMRPILEAKGIELRYSFPKLLSRPPADEGWIHQVLVNLVHNAVKHMRRGGSVIISVNENEQAVVVSVNDNGSGIRTGEQPQVFTEFFQGGILSGAQLEGAGLGLAIVKRVIEKHNGKVYVGSVEGSGTTVSFTLPLDGVVTENE